MIEFPSFQALVAFDADDAPVVDPVKNHDGGDGTSVDKDFKERFMPGEAHHIPDSSKHLERNEKEMALIESYLFFKAIKVAGFS